MYKLSKRIIFLRLQCNVNRCLHASAISSSKNYYDILGVNKSSDTKEVKRKYYELAKKYHPDVNKNDKEAAKKFQEVSEAYEILGDTEKRKQYDTFGSSSANHQYGGSSYDTSQFYQGFRSSIDPEELFRKIFQEFGGGMFGGFQKQNDFASNLNGHSMTNEVVLDLTLEEAVRGVNKEITINCVSTCPKCGGKRSERGTGLTACSDCGGTGMRTSKSGPFVMQQTCRRCSGTGRFIRYPCTECEGKGNTIQKRKITVAIPAGIDHGQSIRKVINDLNSVTQELYVTIRILESPNFVRNGDDVHSDVAIPLSLAALGGTISVNGLYETLKVEIPEGVNSGDKLRIDGKGVKKMNRSGYGAHILHLKIVTPKRLSNFQRALLQVFADSDDSKTYQTKKNHSLEVDHMAQQLRSFVSPKNQKSDPASSTTETVEEERTSLDPLRLDDIVTYAKDGWNRLKKSIFG